MSANRKSTVGVIFGGRSVEHDVSIVTGHQVMRAFDRARYDVIPLYIDRQGGWFSGAPLLDLRNYKGDIGDQVGVQEAVFSPSTQQRGIILNPRGGLFSKPRVQRLDVVFPALHGSHGEDGTVQGLLELADVPYVGCGVLASALANDKVLCKVLLRQYGLPVLDALTFSREDWRIDADKVLADVQAYLPFPVFVKPATLGSSIGIGKAIDARTLRAALELALNFDRRVLVEQAAVGYKEINCAVLGTGYDVRASVLEQPISFDEFLTYEEKYMRGSGGMKGAERVIPAPLTAELTERVRGMAVQAFQALEGSGTARVDFLVKPEADEVFVNEVNTMPGSLAVYLWQEEGMSATDVVEALVRLAERAHADKRANIYNYETSLVALAAERGLKGAKGGKLGQKAGARPPMRR